MTDNGATTLADQPEACLPPIQTAATDTASNDNLTPALAGDGSSDMIFTIFLLPIKSCASLAGPMDISGTSPLSSNSDNMDLALATTADKAVKAIIPFLKELSDDKWWTALLAAWIKFEAKGPPKSVSSF
jgi:hypothetical protein